MTEAPCSLARPSGVSLDMGRTWMLLVVPWLALTPSTGRDTVSETLEMPLRNAEAWQVLAYDDIRPHEVRFDAAGLRIEVDRSAAPVIHPLTTPRSVRGIRARGRIDGTLQTTPARQGTRGHDDYTLRIGLVEVGTRRPSWFDRLFAPEWVKRLFALAPDDLGVAGIRFHNLGLAASQIGQARQHPLSDLITERVAGVPADDGTFDLSIDLPRAIDVAAVWLSSDGDDTGSRFTVTIDQLELIVAPGASGPNASTGPP